MMLGYIPLRPWQVNALVACDTSFLTALQSIRGAGQFFAQVSLPFVPPGIVLKNGEDLALPLNAAQAAALREMAELAPYGMGEETRLDEAVRKRLQMNASELRWSFPKWQTLTGH
jgi:hypothetical protein